MEELALVGVSHVTAPVEIRERLALEDPGGLAAALAVDGHEAVALSTCNRTELYLVGEGAASAGVAELVARAGPEIEPVVHRVDGIAAATHLFRVAAGLDSLVPGEGQILGQVRDAYEAAQAAGAVGPVLHRLFRHGVRVGKRVRSETPIAESPASVASAAAELAEQVFGELGRRRALVLGSGKMGTLTARNLRARGVADVITLGRAEIAGALVDELRGADIVVGATGAREPVVSAADVRAAMRARRGRPIFFVDIAVPRDVDPAVNDLEGCYVYDIDDLERVVAETVAGRREAAARAEAIVAEEAERFRAWLLTLDVVPAIASLRGLAERIRAEELARAEARLGPLSPSQRRAVESLTSQIVAKLLHVPTVRLKEAAVAAEGAGYAAAVRHLFDLGDER